MEQESGPIVVGLADQTVPLVPEKIGADIVFIKDAPGNIRVKGTRVYNSVIFSTIWAFMLLALAIGDFLYKKTHKIQTDLDFARQIKAPKTARKELRKLKQYIYEDRPQEFYDRIFKILVQYLSNKFLLPAGGVGRTQIRDLLEKRQIDKPILNDVESIFLECESIRYASAKVNDGQMNVTHQRLERIIDYLERKIR
jgi:hypothetical protein